MLLNEIEMSVKASNDQSNLFSHYHCRYDVKLSYNGVDFSFPYQCSKEMYFCLKDVLYSVLVDASAFEESKDILDFAFAFCYCDADKARESYESCENAFHWIDFCFTDEQVKELWDEVG